MNENTEIDISEYYQIPLSSLSLQDNYAKLVKRIMKLNGSNNSLGEMFIVESVGDIVALEPYQFSQCKGVGNNYIEMLIEFKKELPYFLSKLKKEPDFVFQDDIFSSINNNYDFETPIYQLALSPKYQKPIKKISVVMDDVITFQDVVEIDSFNKHSDEHIAEVKLPSEAILSKLLINYGFLSNSEIKQLKKIEIFYGEDVCIRNVNALLNIDKFYLAKQKGFGKLFLTVLNDLQERIKVELSTLLENITECTIKKRGFFISSEIAFIEFNEIDSILIEDIDSYLWTLDEMEMDIALSRWGFTHQHETLEEVAIRYSLTRERIRQIEKPINTNLLLNFTIQPKVLWANIREKMTEDLTVLLPHLAKCFATDKLFYAFIELCCQVKSDSIRKIIFTKINPKIINSLFCINPSPISQEIIVNELMSNYGYSKASAINGIKQLGKLDKIEITEQGVYPKNLGKIEAVAHVLTFHPAGLPWKDIARIMNKNNYSKTLFDETRMIQSYLSDSEYVYLCSKGTYRNLIFINFEQFDIPEIMQNLLSYFKKHQVTALHLHDYYYQTTGQRSEIEYFTLRHLVREHGEEYGLYFNGKSNVDSVSLDQDLKRITQTDVIIKMLNESKFVTMQEIAERLRSKSTNHAAFYINILMEEGKVVRVDKMVYTTPEKAFSNIDTQAIMQVIQDIMSVSNIIVEADIFREYVNMELNLSYSKYIYVALVKIQLKELGWYRNSTLFSKNPIPYKNLLDMCKQLCKSELSNNENAKVLQQAVWLTDAMTSDTIQQWKWQMSH